MVESLVARGIARDQQFPIARELPAGGDYDAELGFETGVERNVALSPIPYDELYSTFRESRSFAVMLLDGALLQVTYRFLRNTLVYHRLAYLPHPNLSPYQEDAELYERDSFYANVVDVRSVHVPLRVDFDSNTEAEAMPHPPCHMTLGQFEHCRIPVSHPLGPEQFVRFILMSFYDNPSSRPGFETDAPSTGFAACLTAGDGAEVHVSIP